MAENSSSTSIMSELSAVIRAWEDEHGNANYDPVPTLTRLAEIVEIETENYLKMDPDPFDERHPSRTDPSCNLGQILKALFRKDNFTNKLINDYMRDSYYTRLGISGRDVDQLNIAACRLMLDIMPGLDTTVVFQPEADSLIHRLIKWVTRSIEPLQSYATGLLGAAMEIPEIATRFRELNSKLIPLLLQRLRRLKNSSEFASASTSFSRPFAYFSSLKSPPYRADTMMKSPPPIIRENGVLPVDGIETPSKSGDSEHVPKDQLNERGIKRKLSLENETSPTTTDLMPTVDFRRKRNKLDENHTSVFVGSASPQKGTLSEASNSSWAELETFVIATRQILILRYLTAMGDYQEFLSHVFEHNALELILCYVNVRVTREARLAFEALKYLAALLCHKKFSIEFIQCKGLEVSDPVLLSMVWENRFYFGQVQNQFYLRETGVNRMHLSTTPDGHILEFCLIHICICIIKVN
nr:unnamed protein product [Callosobruchus analis]